MLDSPGDSADRPLYPRLWRRGSLAEWSGLEAATDWPGMVPCAALYSWTSMPAMTLETSHPSNTPHPASPSSGTVYEGGRRRVRWLFGLVLVLMTGGSAAPIFAQSGLARQIEQALVWRDSSSGKSGPSRRVVDRFVGDLEDAGEAGREGAGSPELWRLGILCASLGDSRRGLVEPAKGALEAAGLALVQDQLKGAGAGAFRSWLLVDVVVSASGSTRSAPDQIEREFALSLLARLGVPGLKTALLTVARDRSDRLQPRALDMLARWAGRFGQDDAVDRCLVQQLGAGMRAGDARHPMTLLLRRIESSGEPLGPQAAELLEARLRIMVLQSDWRQPARAMRLLGALPLEGQVGVLLDALEVWDRRSRGEKEYPGLTRIRSDLSGALQEISGKFFGPEPGPWIDWWVAVRLGKEPRPGSAEFEEGQRRRRDEPRSSAGFFGLRPDSDRVTFVLDISGSMSNLWGTTRSTRYEEAVEQLVRFLQAAPEKTRFNVILFNQAALASSSKLVEATAENLERARQALLARVPGGGTNPRAAIEQALLMDADGQPDVDALEADTVIVLCDGATDSGSAWVRPFLDRVLPQYPIRFHSVLIGSESDGTLEALAEQSGGRFRRVGG